MNFSFLNGLKSMTVLKNRRRRIGSADLFRYGHPIPYFKTTGKKEKQKILLHRQHRRLEREGDCKRQRWYDSINGCFRIKPISGTCSRSQAFVTCLISQPTGWSCKTLICLMIRQSLLPSSITMPFIRLASTIYSSIMLRRHNGSCMITREVTVCLDTQLCSGFSLPREALGFQPCHFPSASRWSHLYIPISFHKVNLKHRQRQWLNGSELTSSWFDSFKS